MPKIILITGGVVSSVGKGIITSSLGYLLRTFGVNITCIKIDPYLNIDAGTMSPFEHGEVFVLQDGGEVDLDLGNYERFLDLVLTKDNNITTGKIFDLILQKERQGHFLGKTVQIVPHVTGMIKEWILRVARIPTDGTDKVPDVCLIELGGTPGDIESMTFYESLRQLRFELGTDQFLHIHATFVPELSLSGEQKSKPAQQHLVELRKAGFAEFAKF
ncbi:hypothetical protein MHBO_001315 [Bonamia ostreae]|uniref:CTP synthase N-terminal domain-containing protein n=1 Tax=Bonamia ostreae TaxID=126728 RepID=A0ABV2AJS0_9EUKA